MSHRPSNRPTEGRAKRNDWLRGSERHQGIWRRPQLEGLEVRCLLATFTVTTVADNGINIAPTPGSLRAAILNSEATPPSPPGEPAEARRDVFRKTAGSTLAADRREHGLDAATSDESSLISKEN
jgi:hypothetical protein